MDKLNLLCAFTSFEDCRNTLAKLTEALKDADPAVTVLALEGLYRIERQVQASQFPGLPDPDFPGTSTVDENLVNFQNCLRIWRSESPLSPAYMNSGGYKRTSTFLRSLTIFKTLQVPLFVDDYGKKKVLSSYGNNIENINIDGNTPISHVTHREEAEKIKEEKRFKPSDNKNIIEGCWFGLDSTTSVYGSRSFKTTLSLLGVTGLRQGEIVSYKNEINVILYAVDDTRNFEGLKKPTVDGVEESNPYAYVNVSIFVPSRFLPDRKNFWDVVSKPTEVKHNPFCVKQLRSRSRRSCKELEE